MHQGHASHKVLKRSENKSFLGHVSGKILKSSQNTHVSAPAGSVSCSSPVLEATGSSAHSAAWPDSLQAPSPKMVGNPQLLHSLHTHRMLKKVRRNMALLHGNNEEQACRKGLACNPVHNKRREQTKQASCKLLFSVLLCCAQRCAGRDLHTSLFVCVLCFGFSFYRGRTTTNTEWQTEAQQTKNSSGSLLTPHVIDTAPA